MRRYAAAMSVGSLVHMLTIAVATVIVAVASRTRSTSARSPIDASRVVVVQRVEPGPDSSQS